MERLHNRVAIVTGASSGIGQATARLFANEGATVIALARRQERLDTLHQENNRIIGFACDIQDHNALKQCVDQTVEEYGRIDILVNNAGMSYYTRLLDSSLEQWRHAMSVNIESMFVLTKLVAAQMKDKSYGRIVNISSIQSFYCENITGAYVATKGAISSWTRTLAVDLAEYNILANIVSPGCIRTEISVVGGVDETQTEEFKEIFVKTRRIPLARTGESEEVAYAILMLASEENTYINGHDLVVDGGLSITLGFLPNSLET
jgi:NAD(P)-dependent dehydrogenase (short-subunit alcohol dehydrogenase family)